MTVLAALQAECLSLGTRLFTVTAHDFGSMLFRRIASSHPAEYPATGTKPMLRDAWFDLCIARAETFVANTPAEFAALYVDHALITGMGLGSAVNIPVQSAGVVVGTVNLLAGEGHFTADRLAAYHAAVTRHGAALGPLLARAGVAG
jgi:hypothetical protein